MELKRATWPLASLIRASFWAWAFCRIWSAWASAAGICSERYLLALFTAVSALCFAVSTSLKAVSTSAVGGSASWMVMFTSCRPMSSFSSRAMILSLISPWIWFLPVVMTSSTG